MTNFTPVVRVNLHGGWGATPGFSKQARDCQSSPDGYLIICRQLLWSKQSAHDKQAWYHSRLLFHLLMPTSKHSVTPVEELAYRLGGYLLVIG